MKIRNGFVSNSSSSSFLVKFPRVPISIEEVKELLFGNHDFLNHPYTDDRYTTLEVATTVFNDIQEQTKNDIVRAKELLSGSYNSDIEPEHFLIDKSKGRWESGNIDWSKYNEAQEKWAEKEFERFFSLKKIRKDKLEKMQGKDVMASGEVLYIFNYADDSGTYGSALEHGDIFRNLEHIRISQH